MSTDATPPPLMAPEFVAMMVRGVSVIVASSDAQHRPSIMRAVGSHIAPDARHITVFVSRRQSRQLVADVAATGRIAVVFSEPFTHRTVQLKGLQAQIRDAVVSDEPALARYLASMEIEIARVGYAPPLTRAMLAYRLEDVVAISFTPAQAFDQTPGPKAGAALENAVRKGAA
jgi:hypothetical protein